jgi:hypothetical protein
MRETEAMPGIEMKPYPEETIARLLWPVVIHMGSTGRRTGLIL